MHEYVVMYFVIGAIIAAMTYFFCWNNYDYALAHKKRWEKIVSLLCILACWPVTIIATAYDQYMYRRRK